MISDGAGFGQGVPADDLRRWMTALGCTNTSFDPVAERTFYKAILAGDAGFFIEIAQRLADSLHANDIEVVIGDAQEGMNPVHDLGRAITDTAIELAEYRLGRKIASYACTLAEWASWSAQPHDESCVHLDLDEATFAEKQSAVAGFLPWRAAVEEAIEKLGLDSYRTECLRPVTDKSPPAYDTVPYYEEHGMRRVAEGKYRTAIRYDEHVAPIWRALRRQAERETRRPVPAHAL